MYGTGRSSGARAQSRTAGPPPLCAHSRRAYPKHLVAEVDNNAVFTQKLEGHATPDLKHVHGHVHDAQQQEACTRQPVLRARARARAHAAVRAVPVPAIAHTNDGLHMFLLIGMTPSFCDRPQSPAAMPLNRRPHTTHRTSRPLASRCTIVTRPACWGAEPPRACAHEHARRCRDGAHLVTKEANEAGRESPERALGVVHVALVPAPRVARATERTTPTRHAQPRARCRAPRDVVRAHAVIHVALAKERPVDGAAAVNRINGRTHETPPTQTHTQPRTHTHTHKRTRARPPCSPFPGRRHNRRCRRGRRTQWGSQAPAAAHHRPRRGTRRTARRTASSVCKPIYNPSTARIAKYCNRNGSTSAQLRQSSGGVPPPAHPPVRTSARTHTEMTRSRFSPRCSARVSTGSRYYCTHTRPQRAPPTGNFTRTTSS